MAQFSESIVEDAALAWLESLGWSVKIGPEIAPGEPSAQRTDCGQVVLEQRLCDALAPAPSPSAPRELQSIPGFSRILGLP